MLTKTYTLGMSLCLLSAAAMSMPADAQTTNFTGLGDGTSWIDALNWDAGDPNGATYDAVIDGAGGSPFDVVLTTARLVDSLTIGDEDILRITNGDNLEVGTLIDNNSAIRLLAAGVNTDLRIESAVTLTGGGSILMEGSTARITDATGTADTGHLTVQANSSILGQGSIGTNRTQLTNHGTIRANVDGGILNVDPGANGMVNDGLLDSTQLSTLRLNQGAYTNTNGTIRAQDGSNVELFSGPSITNGSLITLGTGVIETGNATAASLTDVSLDGFLRINNSDNIELIGTLTGTATSDILIDSVGSFTDLLIESTVNLTGGSTIQMAGTNARILDESGTTDGHLINNDFLIHGQGNIGFNRTQITNHSTIRANVAGQTLEIDPDARGMVNDSLLEASNTGTLRLNAAAYNNIGGTIRAQTGSTVELFSGPAITNGTLQTVGTGVIMTGNSTITTLTDVTLDGLLVVDNTDNLELGGTFTTNPSSVVRLDSAGSFTDLLIESAVNLTGGGTIEMIGTSARILDESGATDGHLINNDHLIHGQGNIGFNRTQITNHSTIRADVLGTSLEIDPGAGGMVNTGLIEATSSATLRLNSAAYNNTGGTIHADTDSFVRFIGGPTIAGGTIQTTGNGLMLTGDASITALDGVTINGQVLIDNADNLELRGTVTNNAASLITVGSLGSSTDLLIEGDTTLTGGGTVELTGSAARILDETGLLLGHLTNNDNLIHGRGNIGFNRTQITNGGTIAADVAGQTLFIDVDPRGLANTGTLRATNTALLHIEDGFANDGNIVAEADSTVRIDDTLTNNVGGILSGNGLIQMGSSGDQDVVNDGEIAPGASAGELTMDVGTLTFSATSSLTAEVGGLTPVTDYDRLTVFGDVVLGGTLDASILGGFTPTVGDVFDILLASGSVSGTFDAVNLPAGPGEGFGIFYGSNFVRLMVLRIDGDLNGDGFVGLDDLDIILNHWNQNVTVGDPSLGDVSGAGGTPDGFVGLDDLDVVLLGWNNGTPFPSTPTPPAVGSAVPEPSVIGLMLVGAGWLGCRRG